MTVVLCETILGTDKYTDALAYRAAWASDFVMLMLRLQKSERETVGK